MGSFLKPGERRGNMAQTTAIFWMVLTVLCTSNWGFASENAAVKKNPIVPHRSVVAILMTHVPARTAILNDIQSTLPKAIGIALHPARLTPAGQEKLDEIAQKGHDIFTMIPMEPYDYKRNDGGFNTLGVGVSGQENGRRLADHIAQRPFIKGVMPFLGTRFLTSKPDMMKLFDALSLRNLIYVEPAPLPKSVSLTVCAGETQKPLCLTAGMRLPRLVSLESSLGFRDLVLKIHHLGSVLLYTDYDTDMHKTMPAYIDALGRAGIGVVPVSFLKTN